MNTNTYEIREMDESMKDKPEWVPLTSAQAATLLPLNREERRKEAKRMGLFSKRRRP